MSVISYKVRARGKWDWREFDTVRMEISVGQDYHEGEKLRAAMNWARDNFSYRFIILGDTTQRYNIMYETGCSEKEAYLRAKSLGDEWIERNTDYLDNISVIRWDEWKCRPDYENTHNRIIAFYNENLSFRSALQGASLEFWNRKQYSTFAKEEFLKQSEQYLLEETAVFAVAYKELGGISAYPGTFLELWEMFIGDSNDFDIPEGLRKGQWARLSFDKKKAG